MMQLESLLELAKSRRAVRHFTSEPVPEDVLDQILECARWAPSGYNLQPVHFWVVTGQGNREALKRACFNQPQVDEAPVVVVLAGDREVHKAHLDEMIRMELEAGTMDEKYAGLIRQFVNLGFTTGPLGLSWLVKALLAPVARLFVPVPQFPSQDKRAWLTRQASLAGMNLMLAAHAAGYDSCPMEGFDEGRVRKALGIPRRYLPHLVIPIGRRAGESAPRKTRFPMEELVHPVS